MCCHSKQTFNKRGGAELYNLDAISYGSSSEPLTKLTVKSLIQILTSTRETLKGESKVNTNFIHCVMFILFPVSWLYMEGKVYLILILSSCHIQAQKDFMIETVVDLRYDYNVFRQYQ